MSMPATSVQSSRQDQNREHGAGRFLGCFPSRRRGARGASQTSLSQELPEDPVAAALAPAVKDIHTEVGDRLDAYAVFKPKLRDSLDLFQVVYIYGDTEPRCKSPHPTAANLKTICDTMVEGEEMYGIESRLNKKSLGMLCDQMGKTSSDGNGEEPIFAAITEASVETALTVDGSAGVPGLFSANVNRSRTRVETHEISISVTELERYDGGGALAKLIWENGAVLFYEILLELGEDLDLSNDEDVPMPSDGGDQCERDARRKAIAIVTKKIIGDIQISRERTSSTAYGAGAGGPEGTVNVALNVDRSRLERDVNHPKRGVIGIQYIMFLIKDFGDLHFRFFRGIRVLKAPDGKDSTDKSSRFMGWLSGDNPDDNPCGGSCDVHMRKACMSAPPSRTNSLPSVDVFPQMASPKDDMYVDVTLQRNSDWFDIDLMPRLNDFAMDQCELAAQYRAKANRNASEGNGSEGIRAQRARSTALLRSALRKVCYRSALRALSDLADCYGSGVGVVHEEDTASALRYCARFLERVREAQWMWKQLLMERRSFRREPQPEKRVIRLLSISGPRKHFIRCPMLDIVDVFIVARSINRLCASHQYRHMLAAVIIYLHTVARGDGTIVFNLALLLRYGKEQVQTNLPAVVALCRLVAERDNCAAMNNLALLLGDGDGDVEKKVPIVFGQYLQALRHLRATPMFNIARLLDFRYEGIAKNVPAALALLCRAIGRHDTIAIRSLALHLEHDRHRRMVFPAKTYHLWVSKKRLHTVTRRLQEAFGAAIHVCNDIMLDGRQLVSIYGTLAHYFIARQLISEIVENSRPGHGGSDARLQWASDISRHLTAREHGRQFGKSGMRVLVPTNLFPNEKVGLMINNLGAGDLGAIFGLQVRFGTKIQVMKRPETIQEKVAKFMAEIANKSKKPMLLSPTAKSSYPSPANCTMQRPSISELYHHDATAPPPSMSSGATNDEHQASLGHDNGDSGQQLPSLHSGTIRKEHGNSKDRFAQDTASNVDEHQAVQKNPQKPVKKSQYCNKFGFALKIKLDPVFADLEEGRLQLNVVISQNDTISSIKKQIFRHAAIFERKGYPSWSQEILGPGREYENHLWCQLVFRGAFASTEESMKSEYMHLFTKYTSCQRVLDERAIEDLMEYIQVLRKLDQIYERVERYGMCSTEYRVIIRSGFLGRDRQTITANPEGCRMSKAHANSDNSNGRTVGELIVWPPPATGCRLSRRPQIVKLEVAKEVVASKFRDLQLRDVEDLGLHELKNHDLRLLLTTQRFANGTELLAHKFYLGNHVRNGFMSSLVRHWLLADAKGNESGFQPLLLLPDQTSMELVRVMVAATCHGTPDQIRLLCWAISEKKEVWECCEVIASVSVTSGNVARARLALTCLGPAEFRAVQNATRLYHKGTCTTGPYLDHDGQNSEELEILLRFAEADSWNVLLTAYIQLKEIGLTNQSAAFYAEQIGSDGEARRLKKLIPYLMYSSGRQEIVDASRTLEELEMCVTRLKTLPKIDESTEHLKVLLRFAKSDSWNRLLTAYVHLKGIGLTIQSAAFHAEQIGSDEEAQRLEELIPYLRQCRMRRHIGDASHSLQDLELYVAMLNGGQQSDTSRGESLLMRLLDTAGYRCVAALDVPVEAGAEQGNRATWILALLVPLFDTASLNVNERRNVATWMASGSSDAVCMLGGIFFHASLGNKNPAPPRDDALLQVLTGQSRLNVNRGKWEFLRFEDETTVSTVFSIFSSSTTKKVPVWRDIHNIDSYQRSHEYLSEQIYFHTNGSELPDACGLSLVKLERGGCGELVNGGLTITPRIADDIWHLGGDVYYSMSKGRVWKMEQIGSSYYAGQVKKVVGRFFEMSPGGLLHKTIS